MDESVLTLLAVGLNIFGITKKIEIGNAFWATGNKNLKNVWSKKFRKLLWFESVIFEKNLNNIKILFWELF